MTSTTRQPKASNTPKSCETASPKAGTATHTLSYTDNMSPIQTSFRTIPTPEPNTAHSTRRPASRTHQLHSHSEPKTCCMHVHQQQSQTYKMGEPPALREVKHPHRDRTYVSRSPSTEQEVLSQFSGYSDEIEHFTRDPYKSHLKSCLQSTEHASKEQEVNTCTNCEHSYRHMNDHLTQNTGRMQQQHHQHSSHAEFLPGMENIPALLWNKSIQGNEKNVDTCTFISGSTTLSTPTHPKKSTQNFHQLEKESSNTVALPGFNHHADTTTHVETSRNVHSNGTLSTSLKTDTNIYANMDTNHTAHRYRHTGKEVHLLSGPSELRPLEAMAHRYTRKEAHLLSGPSKLHQYTVHRDTRKEAHLLSRPSEPQPTESPVSETQKFDSAHVQLPRQEYSQLTETEKAKFQDPFIYNDDRNFVRHNSVDKFSPNLVFMTTPNTSVSNSVFCRKKGRKCGKCRDSRNSRRTCTCTYSRRTCTCTCTCSHTGVTTLQEQGKVLC